MQHGMLFHALEGTGNGVDVEQVLITLPAPVDEALLVRAWQRVFAERDVLRAAFDWEERDTPVQVIGEPVPLPVSRADWRRLDGADRQGELERLMLQDRRRGFDLSRAPLARLTAIDCGERWLLLWTFHHALLDGRSFPLVLEDVFECYDAWRSDREPCLPQRRAYADYLVWLQTQSFDRSEPYWRGRLTGFGAPTPYPPAHPDRTDAEWGAVEQILSAADTAALSRFARERGITLATLLHAAWALVLSRYTGQDDVVFGATRACRRSTIDRAEQMVGLFINTLPVRTRVDDEAPVDGWLAALRQQQIDLRDHEHTPLSTVQGWSDVPRGTSLFETLVVFDHEPLEARLQARGGPWADRRFQYRGQTNFPAALIAYGGDALLLRFEYQRPRVDDLAANRTVGHVTMALRGLLAHAGGRIGDIDILTTEERAELVSAERAETFEPYLLHERFERQVAATPDAVAVTTETEVLTYAALNARANKLAHRLLALGVDADTRVGLSVRPSADIVVGILGILKAGGAYVPLDPAYPADRLRFMTHDAQLRLVVAGADADVRLFGDQVTVVSLGDLDAHSDENPAVVVSPDNLAYVIYTSGSTGQPKGALVTHANVSRLFEATAHWFEFHADDVWTLFHSYAFDFSVWEMWGALLYGGRLVVVPYWVSRSTDAFLELLARERVTVLNQTPSAFVQLIQADAAAPAALRLRYVVLGGEALDVASLRPWFERRGAETPRVINMYGITETTVHVTYRPITEADLAAGAGSVIGVPIPDLDVYVLDARRRPVPAGITGEMYVAGAGVARGYLNRPELSEAKFVANPVRVGGGRVYRTGDLARRLPNGELEYRGRIDDQVKIRGFRIELGEIEAVLAAAPGVRHATVVADGARDRQRLVGYVVLAPDNDGVGPIRAFVRSKLPEHMVPGVLMRLEALPLTSNGKVDRRALPAADGERLTSRAYAPPRNATEQTLAEIWGWVLRRDRVGIDDNFFELGGDSILSMQLVARCRRAGLRLTTQDVFRHPTIAALAAVAAPIVDGAEGRAASGDVPLTPIAHWFFELDLPDRRHWNQSFLLETPPGIDIGALETALDHIVAHHEALRLRYVDSGSGWHQRSVGLSPKIAVRRVSLAELSSATALRMIRSVGADIHASLDLTSGPLLAAAHFALPDGTGRLLIAVHHLAIDAVSWRVLLEDLEAAYHEVAAGRVPQLPVQPCSIATFVDRLIRWADGEARTTLDTWLEQLGRGETGLPRDHEAPGDANRERSARTLSVWLSREETSLLLQQAPAAYRAHIDELLLAPLAAALAEWTGRPDTVVDVESHGRHEIFPDLDLSGTIGWFTAMYPVRLRAAGDSAEPAIRTIKEVLRRIPHRGQSFGALRYLATDPTVRQTLAARPRPELLFNYLGHIEHVLTGSALFALAREDSGPSHAASGQRSHLLEVNALIVDDRLQVQWTFSDRFHDRATVRALAERYVGHLRRMFTVDVAGEVRRTPIDFPLAQLTQGELDQVLAAAPGAVDLYPLSSIQHLFYSVSSLDGTNGIQQWEFALDGPLDPPRLRAAWDQVVARHPMLRTAFVKTADTEPLQAVQATATLRWQEEDWRGRPKDEVEQARAQFLADDRARPFDLTTAPLMRAALVRLADDHYRLIWTTQYLLIDGWSWPIIFRELAALYSEERGRDAALPPACGFRAYIEWLQRYDLAAGDRFWRAQLDKFSEPTPLIMRMRRPGEESSAPVEIVRRLSVETSRAVEAAARAAQVTPGAVIAAAWSLALAHVSGRDDVVFGASFQGRPAVVAGMDAMVGPCANDVPVRVAVEGELAVGAWLQQVHAHLHELSDFQHTPLTRIHAGTAVPASHRLFDSLLKVFYEHVEDSAVLRLGSARLTPMRRPEATSYPLTVVVRFEGVAEIKLTSKPSASREVDAAAMLEVLVAALHALAFEQPETVAALAASLPAGLRGRARDAAAGGDRRRMPVVAPRTEMERMVAQVWQELFGDETIGLDENWFDLGAHSLLLERAHAALRERIKPDLTIVELLQYPTVRALAAYLSHTATRRQTDPAARAQQQRQAANRRRTLARTS
jgi:amino acid adenylation domain-containing protein/non-ribosomal peptide synthase protein (TIGR01720 family)